MSFHPWSYHKTPLIDFIQSSTNPSFLKMAVFLNEKSPMNISHEAFPSDYFIL
jgi:hypothetical protein